MGFDTSSILDIVTSGDLAWEGLKAREEELFQNLGTRCLVLGNGDDDVEYVESTGCVLADVEQADFILARGSFVVVDSKGVQRYAPNIMEGSGGTRVKGILEEARQRGIPMLVTNPDFLRPGTNDPMPGLIGQDYQEAGGRTEMVGKPYSLVYHKCLEVLKMDQESQEAKSRVCAVGDSLSHDILGALDAKMSSVFITSGVHSQEFGVEQGSAEMPNPLLLSSLFCTHLKGGATPTHSTPCFRW
ncbi:unnamed protein product [Choristocarpus tenellus]